MKGFLLGFLGLTLLEIFATTDQSAAVGGAFASLTNGIASFMSPDIPAFRPKAKKTSATTAASSSGAAAPPVVYAALPAAGLSQSGVYAAPPAASQGSQGLGVGMIA
ncbi:MAG TPA: hypothetical protein VKQ71_17640 [Acidimicrobiales bacterium]|nr:hypothetical protein [Acidimicrobiales bacterium]